MLKIAFGRFNPPTIGHLKLFKEVDIILTTQTQNKNNPLTYQQKIDIIGELFPSKIINEKYNNLFDYVEKNGNQFILYCGDDRVKDYSNIGCGLVTITRDEVSATLARKYVLDNDFLNFSKVVIGNNKYNIFNQIRVYYDQIKKTHIT